MGPFCAASAAKSLSLNKRSRARGRPIPGAALLEKGRQGRGADGFKIRVHFAFQPFESGFQMVSQDSRDGMAHFAFQPLVKVSSRLRQHVGHHHPRRQFAGVDILRDVPRSGADGDQLLRPDARHRSLEALHALLVQKRRAGALFPSAGRWARGRGRFGTRNRSGHRSDVVATLAFEGRVGRRRSMASSRVGSFNPARAAGAACWCGDGARRRPRGWARRRSRGSDRCRRAAKRCKPRGGKGPGPR